MADTDNTSELQQVVFLSSFEHDVHLGFADAIGAEVTNFRSTYQGPGKGTPIGDAIAGSQWPECDVYIIEGSSPLYAAAARSFIDDTPVIYLGADRGMYALQRASGRIERNSLLNSFLETLCPTTLGPVINRTVDGAIVVSDFIADYTRNLVGPETPIRVAHPYISQEFYNLLRTVEPDLSSSNVVTVGRAMSYKGFDQLVESWPQVRNHHPSAELTIVGPGDHPQTYESIPGVTVAGYVEELADVFRNASLFVQPSRGDAFPLTTVEAMCAGVPALVTMSVGTRSEVRAVDGDLVVDSSTTALAEGVIDYLNRTIDERQALSRRARKRGSLFDPDSRKTAFQKALNSLLRTLGITGSGT